MEKYNSFIEAFNDLTASVSDMDKAKTRQEVEELELKSKELFQALIVKSSYVQSEIREHARQRIGQIVEQEAQNKIGE